MKPIGWILAASGAALLALRSTPAPAVQLPSKLSRVAFPVDGGRWPSKSLLGFGYERTTAHVHQGVDISAPKGATVRAAVPGVVVRTCSSLCPGFSGYGRVVVIQGDLNPAVPQLWWLYAHLDAVLVSEGQRVSAGTPIGRVGDSCFRRTDPTARCKGPHLHFEASPRPYPQDSEAWRYNPKQAMLAIETGTPQRLDTTSGGPLLT